VRRTKDVKGIRDFWSWRGTLTAREKKGGKRADHGLSGRTSKPRITVAVRARKGKKGKQASSGSVIGNIGGSTKKINGERVSEVPNASKRKWGKVWEKVEKERFAIDVNPTNLARKQKGRDLTVHMPRNKIGKTKEPNARIRAIEIILRRGELLDCWQGGGEGARKEFGQGERRLRWGVKGSNAVGGERKRAGRGAVTGSFRR